MTTDGPAVSEISALDPVASVTVTPNTSDESALESVLSYAIYKLEMGNSQESKVPFSV